MTPASPAVLMLVGLAVLVWPGNARQRRLVAPGRRRDRRPARGGSRVDQAGDAAGRRTEGRLGRALVPLAPALVVVIVAPGVWWVVPLVAVAIAARRRADGRSPARRARRQADLAVHHELLAACLDAGMPAGVALRAVAEAVPRPASATARSPDGATRTEPDPFAALEAVAAMLELGAAADAAWRPADDDPDLRPLAGAARRSAVGGAGLADAVREQARTLRAQVDAAERQATGRAGVLMVAPLGLCFLPAFLCLGLAPVVLGLLDRLNLF